MPFRTLMKRIALPVTIVTAALTTSAQEAAVKKTDAAEFGVSFPVGTYRNLNDGVGGPPTVDLSRVIGKRPVVFCYWIAGNARSEQVLKDMQALADELGPAKIIVYGVATERPGLDAARIVERIRAVKLHVPVLLDEGFELGQHLRVKNVPSISVVDAEGKLRMTGAGSLKQPLEYKMDVEAAVRRAAVTGSLGTYGALPRWYPVQELVGQKSPDFEAPMLEGDGVRRWSQLMAADKVNVLVFWSVDCPHCRTSLPELSDWLEKNPAGVNVFTAVNVPNEAVRVKTQEFCKSNDLNLPVLLDEDREIWQRFQVISTPTVVIVRPDGVIDSVILSGVADVGRALEEKRKLLLGSSS